MTISMLFINFYFSYWFHLDESIPPGTEFGILKARDVDEGENGHVIYTLLNNSLPFRIYPRGRDSILATTGPMGNEEQYHLVIEARDHGNPSKVTLVPVDVFVVRAGRPVKEVDIKKQHKKLEKTTTWAPETTRVIVTRPPETVKVTVTTRTTTASPPVTYPSKEDLINKAIDEATKEFQELVDSPENPQNERKPSYSTTESPEEQVRIKAVLLRSSNREEKKLAKDPVALRGVAQVTGRPRAHLTGLIPATSTTEKTERAENNELQESGEEAKEEKEDLGEGPEAKVSG